MAIMSSDLGFCRYAGHSGAINITWDRDTVVKVECGFGDYRTCGYADICELYQRHPIGSTQTYPNDMRDKAVE